MLVVFQIQGMSYSLRSKVYTSASIEKLVCEWYLAKPAVVKHTYDSYALAIYLGISASETYSNTC